jgi:hypothetical protein
MAKHSESNFCETQRKKSVHQRDSNDSKNALKKTSWFCSVGCGFKTKTHGKSKSAFHDPVESSLVVVPMLLLLFVGEMGLQVRFQCLNLFGDLKERPNPPTETQQRHGNTIRF